MLLRSILGAILLLAMVPVNLVASTADDLQSASEKSRVAFVLVTEPGATGVDHATNIINDAMKEVENSVFIEFNRTDEENASLVKKYRLSSAPVPLILAFASNGVMAGGVQASRANSQKLVEMIPSPKKAEVIKSIQSGQSVFVTASRKGMVGKSEIYDACMAACGMMKDKSRCIQVDMDDKAELSFLKELKINMQAVEPVTVVVNAQGKIAGSFNGAVDVSKLVQTAKKSVGGGCCPTGSGKTCGPTKKTKKAK